MKYKLNNDGTYQIVGKTYTENDRTYMINSADTTEQLEAIGVFEVQKKPLQDGFQYSNETELIDGVVYYKQVEMPVMTVPDSRILNEMMFDVSKVKDDIKRVFGDRRFVLLPYWGGITDNLKTPMQPKHFEELKNIMLGLKAMGKVTQDDVDKFSSCFMLQNIDLTTY